MSKMASCVLSMSILIYCLICELVVAVPSTWDEVSGLSSSGSSRTSSPLPVVTTASSTPPYPEAAIAEEEIAFEAAFQGECQVQNPCHQLCFDLHDGTFECACRDNYFLSDNGYSCIPIDASHESSSSEIPQETLPHNQPANHDVSHQHDSIHTNIPEDDDSYIKHHHNHHSSNDFQQHLFDSPELIDSNESVDLDQFSSSSNHKIVKLEKSPIKWEEVKTTDLQDDGLLSQHDGNNIKPNNNFAEGSSDSITKKERDEEDVRKYNHLASEDFKSCLEIECEAGGTCVTEHISLDPRSSRLESQVYGHSSSFISASSPSKYNGTRVRCRCPLGRKGFFCEKPSEVRFPRFRGTSYLALPTLRNSEKSMQLTLEFRPEHYEGLLLYSGEKQTLEGDFIALLLNQGFVEFRFDCGMGEGVVRSERPVLLNSWNRVTVYRDGWTAWLTLNGGQQISGQSQGLFTQINFELELFLGGSPNITLVSQRTNSFTGFTGCTRKLEINGRSYDFRSDNRGDAIDGVDIEECGADVCSHTSCLNGGQCVAQSPEKGICLCPLGFSGVNCELESAFTVPSFNGSSYLQFPGLAESSGLYLEMQVVFKPRALNGVILYNGQRVDGGGDFVSLNLVDGFVEFRFNPGNGPAVIRSLSPIELSEWHTIYASRTAMMGALQVDEQPEVGGYSAGAFTQLSLPLNLFIGGVADMKDVSRDAGITQSFSGCVQRVVINGRSLNLKAEALSGVNIADCPHPCTSEPCQRGGHCEPVLDSYVCHCPLGLVGENCERDVEEITIPMFYGNSYLLFTDDEIMKRVIGSKMDLHLRFRAFAPEGLVIWSGDQNKTSTSNDFMSLSLDQGLIRYTFNLGSGEVTLLNNYTRVDDGVWHSLRITRFKREATLRLDSWPVITGSSPGTHIQLNVVNGLFLGGLENVSNGTRSKHKNGIIGCISHMTLSQDYHVKLITQATKEVNIRTCI